MHDPAFFAPAVGTPTDLHRGGRYGFRFTSPVVTPWPRNNIVHGRLFACATNWAAHPTVLMLHGWNAEWGYRTLFPGVARRLNRVGVNAVMFELPYHSRRKPRPLPRGDAPRNFLSGDLVHVVTAAHQSIADARALMAWVRAQGCERIGVWGVSLGAWLGGVLACVEPGLECAALLTPVVRMDRVIRDLEFCAPLRRALGNTPVRLEPLNLASLRLRMPPERVLLVASEHDLFAPIETIEELCRAWNSPELWRRRQTH